LKKKKKRERGGEQIDRKKERNRFNRYESVVKEENVE